MTIIIGFCKILFWLCIATILLEIIFILGCIGLRQMDKVANTPWLRHVWYEWRNRR